MPQFTPGCAKGPVRSFCEQAWGGLKDGVSRVESTNRPNQLVRIPQLDNDALQQAWRFLLVRHSVLSVHIEERNGSPWLVPSADSSNPLFVLDYCGRPKAEARGEAERGVGTAVWTRFDVLRGPLCRAYAVRFGRDEFYVGVVVHHYIADGISIAILMQEMLHVYLAFLRKQAPSLPPVTLTYQEYLQSVNTWIEGEDGTRVRARAVSRLEHIPSLDFGLHLETGNLDREIFQIEPDAFESIRETARTLRTSAFTILLAAHQMLLAPFCSGPQVATRVITTGREAPSLMRIVGNMADRMFVLTDLSGNPDFAEIVARTHKSLATSLKYAFVRDDFIHADISQKGFYRAAPVLNFTQVRGRREPVLTQDDARLQVPPAPEIATARARDCHYLVMTADDQEIRGDLSFGAGKIAGFVNAYKKLLAICCADHALRLDSALHAAPLGD